MDRMADRVIDLWQVHPTRGALNFAAIFLFILAIEALPLADAMVIAMAAPLFMLAASAVYLNEHIDWRRWTARMVGSTGVLVLIRATGEAFNLARLCALGAAFAYSLFFTQTSSLTFTERTGTTLLYSAVCVFVASAAAAPWVWQPVRLEDLGLMLTAGVLVGIEHYCFIQDYRYATLAPFDFTALVWDTRLGWVIWDQLPDRITLSGATMIVTSGLYAIVREAHLTRKARPA
jgi:drug/metabolite transporter (DMT)-like permease